MEELRRRVDDERLAISDLVSGTNLSPKSSYLTPGIEPPGLAAAPNVVTVTPGMTMAQIERASIEAALRETRGNRRKAAELLDIGERTMYRKLKEYDIPIEGD